MFDITKNNLIYDNPSSGNPADVITVPEQTSQGIEVGFSFTATESFQFYGNASTLSSETESGVRAPFYIPEQTANLGFVWGIGDSVRIITDARYVGDRLGGIPIPSYTVVDASVRFNLGDSFGLTLKADNIFDELYATSNYYDETWLVGKPPRRASRSTSTSRPSCVGSSGPRATRTAAFARPPVFERRLEREPSPRRGTA